MKSIQKLSYTPGLIKNILQKPSHHAADLFIQKPPALLLVMSFGLCLNYLKIEIGDVEIKCQSSNVLKRVMPDALAQLLRRWILNFTSINFSHTNTIYETYATVCSP